MIPESPVLGTIKRGRDIEKGADPSLKYIWVACPDCNQERWVRTIRNLPSSLRCEACRRKGGRFRDNFGYIKLKLMQDNPFYPMTYRGYIPEHRLMMAQYLGRSLESGELVHHLNGLLDDNRLENLVLTTRHEHLCKYHPENIGRGS